MNELVQSIKADLTSKRLLPLLVLFALGLIGALAYAALGSSGSAKPPAPIAAAPLPGGLPVAVAPPNATEATSETPGGAHFQTKGSTRNPFKALVEPKLPTGTGSGTATSSTGTSGKSTPATAGNGSSNGGSAKSAPAGPNVAPAPAPSHHAPAPKHSYKPVPLPGYTVSALLGPAPATPGQQPALTPYEDMKLFEPLPSAKVPLLVFLGVRNNDQAVFGLAVPAILHGPASCYPTSSQCQAILLIAGEGEELEYAETNGETAALELKVVRIAKRKATVARAQALRVSKAGRRALVHAGLWALQ